MGGGLESRCVGRVYGADGAVHGTIRTVHTTYAFVVYFKESPTIQWLIMKFMNLEGSDLRVMDVILLAFFRTNEKREKLQSG